MPGLHGFGQGLGGGGFEKKVPYKEDGGAGGNRGRYIDNSGLRTLLGMVHSTCRFIVCPCLYPVLFLPKVKQCSG